MSSQHASAARKLRRRLEALDGGGAPPQRFVSEGEGEIAISWAAGSKEGTTDLRCGDAVLRVSNERLERLRALWEAGDARSREGEARSREGEACFWSCVARVMLRYQALDGGGFQCAIPPPVFEALRRLWGELRQSVAGAGAPNDCMQRRPNDSAE